MLQRIVRMILENSGSADEDTALVLSEVLSYYDEPFAKGLHHSIEQAHGRRLRTRLAWPFVGTRLPIRSHSAQRRQFSRARNILRNREYGKQYLLNMLNDENRQSEFAREFRLTPHAFKTLLDKV